MKSRFSSLDTNVLDAVLVSEEGGQTPAAFAVVLITGISAVFCPRACGNLQDIRRRSATAGGSRHHTEESVATFSAVTYESRSQDVGTALPILVLIFSNFFIETLGFKTSAGGFVGFGIPKAGTNGEFAAELRHRTVDRDTAHNGNLTVFSDCLLHRKGL